MRAQRLAVVTAILIASSTISCFGPRQIHLTAAPDIPAAQSTAKVSSTDNGNTKIELAVQHLALPDRVNPGATVYVVWVRATQSNALAQNIGALRVDSDLNGNLSAVTPLHAFELFITAEATQSGSEPYGKRLLYTTVTMK